jgi:glycerophosphoryl diester phosphodiesterase
MNIPRIIAHRGASAVAPENTLAAFRAAAAAGARWVEFDASLTRDGRPVVFHDDRLERTSDGAGLLAETTFEVLKHLDAGSWFAPAFAGEMIPTLEEALETLAELRLGFNMEIKPDRGREAETAHAALVAATAMWPVDAATPLVSSFSRISVAVARDEAPQWPRSFLFDRRPEDWRALGTELKVAGFGANQAHLDAVQVRDIKDAGYKLTAYTVNDLERARTLFDWGVDAVFSDTPGTMVPVFEKSAAEPG